MKESLKLLLAFAPWFAFWFIDGHSLLRLQIGIVAEYAIILAGLVFTSVFSRLASHKRLALGVWHNSRGAVFPSQRDGAGIGRGFSPCFARPPFRVPSGTRRIVA